MQGRVQGWLLGVSLALLAVTLAHGLRSARRQNGLKSSLQAVHSELPELRYHDPLTEAASRLSARVGQAPHVARVAGDEYVLLLHVGKAGAHCCAGCIPSAA